MINFSYVVIERSEPMADAFPISDRNRVRRRSQRASYDRESVNTILDEALVCHVGFSVEEQPYVIPTIHARVEDTLYLHGSAANRMMTTLARGARACVTVTLIDGLVLARSAFHHSMEYRSVVAFGTARAVTEHDEKLEALKQVVEKIMPGRWKDTRPPNDAEMKSTLVVAISIEEASAKIRKGGVVDEEEDYALPNWAGVVPLSLQPQRAVADSKLAASVEVPEYVQRWIRSRIWSAPFEPLP
jgi:nitroimidazol reductase NimA-like FMN-containing flavoprotein (pyridoxamine 5'-phosphate oxidase superfamily)